MLLLQAAAAPQAPAPSSAVLNFRVIVGLDDGMKLNVQDPEFSGFIEGRSGEAVLMYREKTFHGEMPLKTVSKIEFGKYKGGKPFPMKVTLRSGEQLDVVSERRDFMTLRGRTEFGTITVKHPDPINTPLKLGTGKPNRKKGLTIQYLEFPAS